MLFSHRNLVIKISVGLVHVVSLEIFLLSVTHEKMSGDEWINAYGWKNKILLQSFEL